MALQGILSGAGAQPAQGNVSFRQKAAEFQSLLQAIRSGDLPGAQSALAAVMPTDASKNPSISATNPTISVQTDLKALAVATQSGNAVTAQQAFANIQKDIQTYKSNQQQALAQAQNSFSSPAVDQLMNSVASAFLNLSA